MDFELSEELKMIRALAHDFVADQLRPLERDLLGRSADLSDARADLDSGVEARLKETARAAGLWGASVPEEFGGAGLGVLGNCLIEEELAQTIIPFRFGDVTPILFDCNEGQRHDYLEPAVTGEKSVLVAIAEPGNAAFPGMATVAHRVEDGYAISGTKLVMSRPGPNYFAVVFASTGEREVSCFLVDRHSPGFALSDGTPTDGWRSASPGPALLRLEGCAVPRSSLLGEEGKAFNLGRKWLPARRILRAARSVGICQRLLDEAILRAQSWQSFGATISERPAIRTLLAEIAASVHAARLVVWETAWKADEDRMSPGDSAGMKVFAARTLEAVSERVAQIYGGPPGSAVSICDTTPAYFSDLSIELQSYIIVRELLKTGRA